MKELIAARAVEKALLFLAVAGPLVGIIIGTVAGAHERRAWPRILAGGLIGALGAMVYGMWRVYGLVTDALGLDSVANLVLELVTFAVVGALLGVAVLSISNLLRARARQ